MRLWRNERIVTAALVTLQYLALMLVVYITLPGVFQWHSMDLRFYYTYSLGLLQGKVPYRDFPIEYPPLALLPFAFPHLLGAGRAVSFPHYVWYFLLESALLSTLIALGIASAVARWESGRRLVPALGFYALLVAISAPLLPWRYDLFPALLTLLGVLAVLGGRPMLAGVWIGLGVATKLYPLVLLPVLGVCYLASRDYRGLVRLALGSAAAVGLALLPLVGIGALGQLFSFLSYHQLRGLQVESLGAGVIELLHLFGRTSAKVVFNYGALHLEAPQASAVLAWLPIAFVVALGTVIVAAFLRFRREYAETGAIAAESLIVAVMAALLAFILTNKVFSPQYLVWLLPFVPLLRPRQATLMLVAVAMTIAIFPYSYNDLLAFKPYAVWLLNMRNALMLALFVWLVADLAPAARTHATVRGLPSSGAIGKARVEPVEGSEAR